MNAGRKNSKPNIGIHGRAGGTRPGLPRGEKKGKNKGQVVKLVLFFIVLA